jgi:hypothetical protein
MGKDVRDGTTERRKLHTKEFDSAFAGKPSALLGILRFGERISIS